MERNLGALLGPAGRRLWEASYHYALARKQYRLEDVIGAARDALLDRR